MKIVMATHYFESHRGGIEIVAGKLFREFATLGQQITWIASDASPAPEPVRGQKVVPVRASNVIEAKLGLPLPFPAPGALKHIRHEIRDADIVLIHDCLYFTNIATFLFAQRQRVPVMVIQHIGIVPYSNIIVRYLMKAANAIITRWMLQRSDQVIFISETTKRYFNRFQLKRPPVIVFNGVDTDIFKPAPEANLKSQIRRRLQLPVDKPLFLFVGRFVEKKGLPVLKEMAQLSPNQSWVFCGWGPLDPRRWNLNNVYVFSDLRGLGLAELYRASDVFVLPSTGEGFPLVIQEALASGIPVVCGLETSQADPELSSVVHGVELDSDHRQSAMAFLGVIEKVMTPVTALAVNSDKYRRFALLRYSWNKAAERYLKIASDLIGQRIDVVTRTT